ncbi:MAG TPA: tetratricopeptide repeat protein [Bacteroidota bacterium]|nr:tetratricopeptide repeat protein [Bacteroidota bacterium]
MSLLRWCSLLALILLACALVPSCGVVDFVSAYFNTYYNARRLFNDAETEVMAQLDARPGGRNWLSTCAIQAGTRGKLESVIEKCSKLLQYHPESSLVDDALMMIGKSYYYEDDNQQAMRKFNEIISQYPDGARAMEARLLLSYAQYRMGSRDDARKTGETVADLARKNDKPDILSRACLVLGQLSVEDRDFAKATGYFEEAAKSGATPEQRSSAWLMSASMYQKLGNYAEAESAYASADRASNTYVGEFRGRIGALRMAEKQGRTDEALRGYRLLRADAKFKEFFGEIELEIANTYRDMGDLPLAVARYTYVDTAYPRSETSARSYFSLGDLYEHTLYRYDSALVAYSKGRNESPAAEIAPIAAHRADYLTKYFQYHSEIVKFDSVRSVLSAMIDSARTAGGAPPGGDSLRTRTSRDSLRGPAPADSLRAHAAADTVRARPASDSLHPRIDPRVAMIDTANARLEVATNELAGLFYATIGIPDSAEAWYRVVLDNYPDGRYAARALYTLAQIYSARDSVANKPLADSLYRQILARFPRSEFAPEARRLLGLPPVEISVDAADSLYGRAEALLVSGDSAAAAVRFKQVAGSFPASPLAPRALYAAGWIYENSLMNNDSAIASYTRLASLYPASVFAARIAPKMFEVMQARQKAAADSAAARRAAQLRADSIATRRAAADTAASRRLTPQAAGAGNTVAGKPGELPKTPAANVTADTSAAKGAADDTLEVRKIRKGPPKRVPGKEGSPPE